ncbi:hypothetical protein [Halorussus litoreus]|nr:hypothetical protein [Halorussus litoreus]
MGTGVVGSRRVAGRKLELHQQAGWPAAVRFPDRRGPARHRNPDSEVA